jgi:hypothetical protein
MSQIICDEIDPRKCPKGFRWFELTWSALELCEVNDVWGADVSLFAPIAEDFSIIYESAYWAKKAKSGSDFDLQVPFSVVFEIEEIDNDNPTYTLDDSFSLHGFAPVNTVEWYLSEKKKAETPWANDPNDLHEDEDGDNWDELDD